MIKQLSGLLFACFLAGGPSAQGQLPQRISDLNATGFLTAPRSLTSFNNKLYFSADDGTTGRTMWSYDGSSVAAATPGFSVGDFGVPNVANSSFPILNGKMYFLDDFPSFPGNRLYRFDGTNTPDLAPGITGTISFDQSDLITFANRIFFAAGTTATGSELYAYDGVNPPTVYNINPSGSSSPHGFTVFKGKLYFLANGNNTTEGEELHVYDPVSDECSLVADIYAGSNGCNCRGFTVAGNVMYFAASQSGTGLELWETDGGYIRRLTDLAPGNQWGVGATSANYKGSILFNGSANGTDFYPYKFDIASGQALRVSTDDEIKGIGWSAEYKGNLYFGSTKGTGTTGSGTELWKFDGTNLTMLPEIWPGQKSSNPGNFVVHDNALYFVAQDSAHGYNLYRFNDPTAIVNTQFNGEIKLFPNPASTTAKMELTLKNAQQLSLSVTDMTGREVYTTGKRNWNSGKTEIDIPLRSLAPGSYCYVLVNGIGNIMARGKLLKQ